MESDSFTSEEEEKKSHKPTLKPKSQCKVVVESEEDSGSSSFITQESPETVNSDSYTSEEEETKSSKKTLKPNSQCKMVEESEEGSNSSSFVTQEEETVSSNQESGKVSNSSSSSHE